MTKNFDTLLESMLAEMMPATMMDDMGTMTSKVTKKVEELPSKSQHWGPLQKLSPETRIEIVKAIIKQVFADNDENTYSTTIDNSEQLKDAIKTAIKNVAEKNPEFKASGKWAAQFLADRLANKELLGNVKYTTMGGDDILQKDATQKEVKQALKKALEQAPSTEEEEEASQEVKTDETPVEEPRVSREYSYNPSAEYYLKSYDEIPSGKLKGDVQVAYDRLSGMAGEAHSGSDFAKTLKNSQMSTSFLKQLFDLGILEFAETDSEDVGDTKGFDETTEDYMDRLTRDARRDYTQSSPGSRFGGEDVFG